MSDHFWLGMMIALGSGILNGIFAWPMKYARLWKWENTWAVFNLVSTVVLPVFLVAFFVPHLAEVYQGVPGRTLLAILIFGFLWGTTHVTIGLSIWAVGMAVALAVIAGMTSCFGSLIPLLVLHGGDIFRPQGLLLLGSMPVLFLGLWLFGKAALAREKEQLTASLALGEPRTGLAKGLALCIYTGAFAGSINLGFAFGGNVTRRSLELGANRMTATYAVWALLLLAGFIPNGAYCSYLLFRNRGWGAFTQTGAAKDGILTVAMSVLWCLAVFGYGIGATVAGKYGTSAGFALWVAMTIVASTVIGILTGEWNGTSPKTRRTLTLAMAMVLGSVIILNLGGLF